MVRVTCRVDSYDDPMKPSVLIESHWNSDRFIVLTAQDGDRPVKVTLHAAQLVAAVKNATNTARGAY